MSSNSPESNLEIACELSMYPLTEEYEADILDFIHRLRSHEDIQVSTNAMSTQVSGPFDLVMPILQAEIKKSFEAPRKIMLVIKMMNFINQYKG